ncbi:hypothetical protein L4D20_04560 [Vibrio kyushuensis]|uniref:hypothetical protein n=1 Tax=Vibrio kyushuensis TaxID=2910249 RepID=UPI003D0CB2B7
MNNSKVYLSVFVASILSLLLLLQLIPSDTNEAEVVGIIIDRSITQSLDGHRQYLIVEVPNTGIVRVSIPTTKECDVGQSVKLKANNHDVSKATSFQFISC